MKHVIVLILWVLCAGYGFSEKLAELPQLNNPISLKIAGDECYIGDGVTINVYAMKDYQLLRSFGKAGEGPGETKIIPEMDPSFDILNDKVVVYGATKIIWFSKDGQFISEKKMQAPSPQFRVFGNGYAVFKFTTGSDQNQYLNIVITDDQFNELKTVYSRKRESPVKLRRIDVPSKILFFEVNEDKLYVVDQMKDFHIGVFDLKGNTLPAIDVPYTLVKVDDYYKKGIMEWLRTSPITRGLPEQIKQMINIIDYLPVIKNFQLLNGFIYVQTFKEKDGNAEFFILDKKGKILKTVWLPVNITEKNVLNNNAGFTFKGDTCYYLKENESTETWELHAVPIK